VWKKLRGFIPCGVSLEIIWLKEREMFGLILSRLLVKEKIVISS
jgi:hypothetical protein